MDDICQPASFEDLSIHSNQPEASNRKNGTGLLDLPDKCLIAIFKWIPLQNLDDIIELSSRCDRLVQENVPLEIHLTDVGFRIAMHYFIGYDELPKYRVKVAHSRVLDEKLPELKAPEDLKVLEFATHTSPATFKTLVSSAVNLQELYFGYGSLSEHLLCELDMKSSNLKLLSISDREVVAKSGNETSKSVISSNISGFLSKHFPSMEEIRIVTSAVKNQTQNYVQDLLLFIQNHYKTLKRVKFDVSTPAQISKKSDVDDNENEYDIGSELCLLQGKLDLNKLSSADLEKFDLRLGEKYSVDLQQWKLILQEYQSELCHCSTKSIVGNTRNAAEETQSGSKTD